MSRVNSLNQAETKDSVTNTFARRIRIRGLSSSKSEMANSRFVTGVVTDKNAKDGLPGVMVKVKGTNKVTVTDAEGKFEIDAPENAILELAYIGYLKEEVIIADNKQLNISLEPSLQAVNDVVIVGYGNRDDAENQIIEAHPVSGWKDFRKYLKDNAKTTSAEKGVVIVAFAVSAGLSKEVDGKAIRLISEGPRWVGDKDNTTKEIKIRIRFR